MVVWSVIEDLSAVVCINLPPCRHLIGQLFPRLLLTSRGGPYTSQSKSVATKQSDPFELGTRPERCGSFTTVESGGRPGFKQEYKSNSTPWLDAPEPLPLSPVRNFSLKAKSVMLVKDEGEGFEPLVGLSVKRPYSAGYAHTLNVEIDRSELGLRDLMQRREAGSRESKWYIRPPRSC